MRRRLEALSEAVSASVNVIGSAIAGNDYPHRANESDRHQEHSKMRENFHLGI